MKVRGFEVVKRFNGEYIDLPIRKTKNAAGYDVMSCEDIIIPPYKLGDKPTLVKTGVKVYMPDDEYLMLCNRSSNPIKRGLVLANGIGVIDADYYNNPDNDGEIMYEFYNFFKEDFVIKKGDTIGQAVFMKYLLADGDNVTTERIGGTGSTDKKNN